MFENNVDYRLPVCRVYAKLDAGSCTDVGNQNGGEVFKHKRKVSVRLHFRKICYLGFIQNLRRDF